MRFVQPIRHPTNSWRECIEDLLDANKGVKYFYLSTDEPYYLGLAHNSQCNEADLAKQLGSVGKIFTHFVNKAGGYLHDQGRTVVFWGEYPLKPSDSRPYRLMSSMARYMVRSLTKPSISVAFSR